MAFTDKQREREYKREWKRQWKLNHREEYLAQHSLEEAKRYRKYRERELAKSKVYKEKNRERVNKWNRASAKRHPETAIRYVNKRRALILKVTVRDCKEAISILRSVKTCFHCNQRIIGTTHIDHLIPLTRGGSHSPDNLVASCRSCNTSKSNLLLCEWKPNEYKEVA